LELTADGAARLARIRPVLEGAIEARGRTPLRMLVERTWIALGGPACTSSDADLEDAATYFDLVDETAYGGDIVNFDSLAQCAADLFAAPDPEASGSVELMTMHKAKGLEFDTVILPGLGRPPRSEDSKLLLWTERPSVEGEKLLLAPISPRREETDALWRYIARQEKIKSENESIRLLYVAATRARRTLHIIGHAELEDDPSGRRLRDPRSDVLLSRIWTAVKPSFEAALSNYPGEQESFAQERGNPPLRRVPQGWRPLPLPPAVPLGRTAIQPDDREDGGSETVRLLGTVTHSLLETMARDGLDRWPVSRITGLRGGVRSTLASLGAPVSELDSAAQHIEQALLNTIADPRGKWILANHEDSRSELKLGAASKGAIAHFAIDRTFVDGGVRWVIDFKTAAYDGDDPDSFIDSERRAYQEQLERYANLLTVLDSRPIRAGLYFPLLKRWIEWEPQRGLGCRPAHSCEAHVD
jgi:ATP-dependent exoDNAse (exonuclease V) beta subunit